MLSLHSTARFTVVDELCRCAETDASVVAFHYCDYADEVTLQVNNILGTLLHQMLRKTSIDDEIEALIVKTDEDEIRSPSSSELTELLETVSRRFETAIVILDGLDECDSENKEDLVGIVKKTLWIWAIVYQDNCR